MKTTELVKLAEGLPEKQKLAILSIIDLKTEQDMEKVLDRIDLMQGVLENKINGLDIEIKGLNVKYNVLLGAISLLGIMIAVLKYLG